MIAAYRRTYSLSRLGATRHCSTSIIYIHISISPLVVTSEAVKLNIENDGQTTSNMSENDNIHKSIPIDAGQPMTSALESRTSVRRT